ncbi:hypothetical protein [Streptomyces albidoflavus]|uniref:hypothetical protein n=1 Tax=Streptomyces albidoflavus TaxID=1886 RepID=UPI00101E2E0E|nr:hypothetical protein [Streptomyces albidoflavus]RZD89300.1 hypothetical protein C0Q60_03565 [Streptomyces albidoflavus]RZE04959.1 hypothetical protein C0Q62_03480 [Streptomyces albidoflavus]
MISASEAAKVVSAYTHRYPAESSILAPLWQTLGQHVLAGGCAHRGTCPVLRVSPVVVDERGMVLILQGRTQAQLPEAAPFVDCETYPEAAVTLARTLGVGEPWTLPGWEAPLLLDPGRADQEDGQRGKVVIRYLFRTHSDLCAFVVGAPQVWVPLGEIDHRVAGRVSSLIGVRVS